MCGCLLEFVLDVWVGASIQQQLKNTPFPGTHSYVNGVVKYLYAEETANQEFVVRNHLIHFNIVALYNRHLQKILLHPIFFVHAHFFAAAYGDSVQQYVDRDVLVTAIKRQLL